jgi:hypothetical protein
MTTEIITPMQMYWLTRLSTLKDGLGFIIFLLFILAVGYFIAGCVLQDPDFSDSTHKRGKKFIKTSPPLAIIAVVLLFVNCLIPSTRSMAAILIVPCIANSEKVQTAGNHLYDLAVEWMEELRPAKNKNGDRK